MATTERLPDTCYDRLPDSPNADRNATPFRWRTSYQGETDYDYNAFVGSRHIGRLHFRWQKVPWLWSWEEKPSWNFKDEAEFERIGPNATHGLLLASAANPVPRHVLDLFRRYHCPVARTGYYDHLTKSYVIYDDAEVPENWVTPSTDSYYASQLAA